MARKTHTEAQARYDKVNRRVYGLRLHNVIDADIIAKLASVDSMQGYIKQLIRDDIARTCSVPKQDGSAPESTCSVPNSPVPKKMSFDEIYLFLQIQADNQPEEYDGLYDLLNALTGKMMGYMPDK